MSRALGPTSIAIALSGLIGCVAVPPLKVGGGVAAAGRSAKIAPAGHVMANVRPLALDKNLRDRPADFGFGAFAEFADRGDVPPEEKLLVGPTLGAEGFPIIWPSAESVGRLVVGGELRALYQPAVDSWGPFVAERIGIEIASYVEDCGFGGGSGGFGIGCGAGEGGIGVFAEIAQGYLDGRFRYSGALIVEVRIPAGIAGGIPFPK